jgi:hypothetical protein
MARDAYGGRTTCESCNSIDVRRWHREGRLRAGQWFSCSWTWGDEPSGSISVRTETDAVVLMFRSRCPGDSEWMSVDQRVPITWSTCHFGGLRPWFRCAVHSNGRYCGRRVAKLYAAGELFACRHCYGLAYESQQEPMHQRGLGRAQKIRLQMGGSQNMFEPFPDKPKGMHWRTYDRRRGAHDVAEARSTMGMMRLVDSLQRQAPGRVRR